MRRLFFGLFFFFITQSAAQTLRIATINVWSGLDYRGTLCMGEVESDSVRSERLSLLLEECRRVQPDLLFLQECNPVGVVGSIFSEGLGYDRIDQRANGGFKIGPLGLP